MFIGIDPGAKGAIALYDDKRHTLLIHDMPYFQMTVGKTRKKRLNGVEILHMLRGFRDIGATMACMEAVGGRPKQSAPTAFVLGWGAGLIYQSLVALSIPVEHIPPAVWKRALRAPAEKRAAVQRANEIFPEQAGLFRGPKGGFMDGRAEAAMIAYFCATKIHQPLTSGMPKSVLDKTSMR